MGGPTNLQVTGQRNRKAQNGSGNTRIALVDPFLAASTLDGGTVSPNFWEKTEQENLEMVE